MKIDDHKRGMNGIETSNFSKNQNFLVSPQQSMQGFHTKYGVLKVTLRNHAI